jgi:hypothetical protein
VNLLCLEVVGSVSKGACGTCRVRKVRCKPPETVTLATQAPSPVADGDHDAGKDGESADEEDEQEVAANVGEVEVEQDEDVMMDDVRGPELTVHPDFADVDLTALLASHEHMMCLITQAATSQALVAKALASYIKD